MAKPTSHDEDLWRFKRYLHLGFETLEKLKNQDDLKNIPSLINLIKTNKSIHQPVFN